MGRSAKKRSASMVEDSDDEAPSAPSIKKTKSAASAAPPAGKDDEGNPYWELSNKRRVGVSEFKSMCFINVREYYEKDGKTLPGKKGISLSIEQYVALLKAVPGINATLRELGHTVDGLENTTDETPEAIQPKKEKSKPTKANIDATSDEDSA